jgi:hypothetical protein
MATRPAILLGKRIHPVYLYGPPAALLDQLIALHLFLTRSPVWPAIAHRLIGSRPSSQALCR